MGVIFDNPAGQITCGDPGDLIEFSALFDGGYLARIMAAGDRKTCSAHLWLKIVTIDGTRRAIIAANQGSTTRGGVLYDGNIEFHDNGSTNRATTGVYKDTAGWFSLLWRKKSDLAIEAERVEFLINGVLANTTTSTALALNAQSQFGTASELRIGGSSQDNPFLAYIAELVFLDGIYAEPTDFGRFNAYGDWVYKAYRGEYGPNGFYLPFSDPLDLGRDQSPRNIALYSEDLNNAVYSKTRVTIVPNATIGAGGEMTAGRIVADAGQAYCYPDQVFATQVGEKYVISWSFKSDDVAHVELAADFPGGSFFTALFDLNDVEALPSISGIGTAPEAVTVAADAEGFVKCSMTITADAASMSVRAYLSDGAAWGRVWAGGEGLYADRLHVREADRPSQYVKTESVVSGGNDFTVSGGVQQSIDTPSRNFSTLEPHFPYNATQGQVIEGNLAVKAEYLSKNAAAIVGHPVSKDHPTYFTCQATVMPTRIRVGLSRRFADRLEPHADCFYYESDGTLSAFNSQSAYGLSFTTQEIGCYCDPATETVTFYRDGAPQGSISAPDIFGEDAWYPAGFADDVNSTTLRFNLGQKSWGYSPPSAAIEYSAAVRRCPDIVNPEEYYGEREELSGADITGLLFDPTQEDALFVSKRLDAVGAMRVVDTLRGPHKFWTPDPSAGAVEDDDPNGIEAFTNDGAQIGSSSDYQGTRVDMIWRVGRVAGFDIKIVDHVTGTDTTVSQNAGGPIEYAWCPNLDGGNVFAFHHKLPADGYYRLNSQSVGTLSNWFSSTANTVTIGASMATGRYALYLWRGVPGFSAFLGHYGTGVADGAMIPTDFAPKMWMYKRYSSGQLPAVQSVVRDPENPVKNTFYIHSSAAQSVTGEDVLMLSNGIKTLTNSIGNNATGEIYVSSIWARSPGKFATAH